MKCIHLCGSKAASSRGEDLGNVHLGEVDKALGLVLPLLRLVGQCQIVFHLFEITKLTVLV